jgi:hypothetical protein
VFCVVVMIVIVVALRCAVAFGWVCRRPYSRLRICFFRGLPYHCLLRYVLRFNSPFFQTKVFRHPTKKHIFHLRLLGTVGFVHILP